MHFDWCVIPKHNTLKAHVSLHSIPPTWRRLLQTDATDTPCVRHRRTECGSGEPTTEQCNYMSHHARLTDSAVARSKRQRSFTFVYSRDKTRTSWLSLAVIPAIDLCSLPSIYSDHRATGSNKWAAVHDVTDNKQYWSRSLCRNFWLRKASNQGLNWAGSRRVSAPAPLIWDPPPLIWDPLPPNGDPAP